MAGVQQDRPRLVHSRLFLADAAPRGRSVGVSVALLIAVLAAIAFFWNVSRRQGHARIEAPIARAEPLATPPITDNDFDNDVDPAVQRGPAPSQIAPPAASPGALAAPDESVERSADDRAEDLQPPTEATLSAREQSQIKRVVEDGRPGLKTCYERALVRDQTLVRGNLRVRVSVAASGHPRGVSISGPAAFRGMKPCLEAAVSNWHFPAASAAYETQFPLALRGAE
jgi:hypothetical protein